MPRLGWIDRYSPRSRRFLNRALFLLLIFVGLFGLYVFVAFGLNEADSARIYAALPAALNGLVAIGVAVLVTTFSFVFVALSLVSVQFSPRIVRHFWHSDPFRRFFLWSYIGIFAGCFAVQFFDAPRVQLLAAVMGCYLIFVIFPAFLTYLANNMNAASIIQTIARRTLIEIIDQYETIPTPAQPENADVIRSKKSGFLESVDTVRLSTEFARIRKSNPGTTLSVSNFLGSFVEVSSRLAEISPAVGLGERSAAAIRKCFHLSRFRSIDQDIEYGIRQLVDIAIKAISPAVNDPTTCVNCLFYLGVIIKSLAVRDSRSFMAKELEKNGILIREPEFERYIDDAFDQIYQWGRSDHVVVRTIINTLSDIISVVTDAGKCEIIVREVDDMELGYLYGSSAESPILLAEHRNHLRKSLKRFYLTAAGQFAKCGQPERENFLRAAAERVAASTE
jgi:uncharacterized membrane protein